MSIDTPMDYPGAKKVTPKGSGTKPSSRRMPLLPPKGTIHTTETRSGTGVTVVRNAKYPYNLVVDPYTREIIQALPMNWVAWSLRGTHARTGAKIETNHAGQYHVQVSIVGYASQMDKLTESQLDWLAEIFATLSKMLGINPVFDEAHGERSPMNRAPYLASTGSPIRKTLAENHDFNGWQLHQTWYGQDHWDPGGLDTLTIEDKVRAILNRPVGTPNDPLDEIQSILQAGVPAIKGLISKLSEAVDILSTNLNQTAERGEQ